MRTAGQVTADEQLTEAIMDVRRAYGYEHGELLTDYIVCAAEQSFDDDGNARTSYCWLYRDGTIPYYRSIGLLEMVLLVLRCQASVPDEAGD